MIHPDTFVGAVAVGLSLFVLGSAIFNWQPVYKSRTPRWIEARFGRSKTRLILGVVGTLLFLIGFYLLSGIASRPASLKRQSRMALPVNPADLVTERLQSVVAE